MMKAEIVGGNQGKLTLSADWSYGSQVVLDGIHTNANEAATKGYVDGVVHDVDGVTLESHPSNQNKLEVKDGGISAGKLQSGVAGGGLPDSELAVNVDSTTIEINADALRIKPGGLAASHLADAAITLDKVHTNVAGAGLTGGAGSALAVDTDNSTIETDSNKLPLKDGGVTKSKLSTNVAGPGLSGGAGQSLSLSVDSSTLELNGSGNLQIKSGGIASTHVGAGAITSAKLASVVETSEFNATTSMTAPAFIATSDRRLKDKIVYTQPVDLLHQVMHMRPASYVFKSEPNALRQGLIAQDLATIAPHLVATVKAVKDGDQDSDSARLAVNYSDLTASLIGAVQALQAQVDEVRAILARASVT